MLNGTQDCWDFDTCRTAGLWLILACTAESCKSLVNSKSRVNLLIPCTYLPKPESSPIFLRSAYSRLGISNILLEGSKLGGSSFSLSGLLFGCNELL